MNKINIRSIIVALLLITFYLTGIADAISFYEATPIAPTFGWYLFYELLKIPLIMFLSILIILVCDGYIKGYGK